MSYEGPSEAEYDDLDDPSARRERSRWMARLREWREHLTIIAREDVGLMEAATVHEVLSEMSERFPEIRDAE